MLLGGDGDECWCLDDLETGVLVDWDLDGNVPLVDELVAEGVEVGDVV